MSENSPWTNLFYPKPYLSTYYTWIVPYDPKMILYDTKIVQCEHKMVHYD